MWRLVSLAILLTGLQAGQARPIGLYAVTAKQQLASVSSASGVISPYASIAVDSVGQTQQLSTLDSLERYLMLSFNFTSQLPTVMAFDLNTGAQLADCALGFAQEGAIMGTGQAIGVNPSDGMVLASVQNATSGRYVVCAVDIKSCNISVVATLDDSLQPALAAPGAFNELTGEMLVQYVNASSGTYTFLAVNTATGAVRAFTDDYATGRVIQTLDYHPGERAFYGTGLEPSPANASEAVRTLVRLDAADYSFTTVGTLPGLTVSDGVLAALDCEGSVLYSVLQRDADGGGPSAPFYLVGLSLANASVVSIAQLCPSLADCPWSIEWNEDR